MIILSGILLQVVQISGIRTASLERDVNTWLPLLPRVLKPPRVKLGGAKFSDLLRFWILAP